MHTTYLARGWLSATFEWTASSVSVTTQYILARREGEGEGGDEGLSLYCVSASDERRGWSAMRRDAETLVGRLWANSSCVKEE